MINRSAAVEDGNLRHALMEYYLSKIASKDLYLDDVKMKVMARGENWKELSNFLKEKEKSGTPLGDFSQLTCRKRLRN